MLRSKFAYKRLVVMHNYMRADPLGRHGLGAAVETAAHLLQAVSWVCYVGKYFSTIKHCSLTETQATEGQINMGHMVRLHIACLHEYSAYRQLHSKCNQLAADANDAMECAPDTKAC